MSIRLLFSAPLLLFCSGCAGTDVPWVELRGQRFNVEIAADDASRTRGLMFRDAMPNDHGMLFIFDQEQPLAFWMRNTRIPLDILYFDSDLNLVSMAAGVPPCTTEQCPNYPSTGPASFTLELNAGVARKLGVRPGDPLLLAPEIVAAHALDSR
jgi:uncharacterized protein